MGNTKLFCASWIGWGLQPRPIKWALSPPSRNHHILREAYVVARESDLLKIKPYVDNFLAQRAIRDDIKLSPDRKLILFILTTYRHVYTLECNPELNWIAQQCNCSKRTIQRHIKYLISEGYLLSIKRGRGKPNNFFLTIDFMGAYQAFHCPDFRGNRKSLDKARKQRMSIDGILSRLDDSESALFVTSLIYKNEDIKRTNNYITECPHCGKDVK